MRLTYHLDAGVSLVEWAERLGARTPTQRLELHFSTPSAGSSQPLPPPGSDEVEEEEEEEEEEEDNVPREIRFRAYGARWAGIGDAILSFIASPPAGSPPLGGLRSLRTA